MKKNHRKAYCIIAGVIIFSIIAIILFVFFLRGKTVQSGQIAEEISDDTVTCENYEIKYPILGSANADSQKTKITLIFNDLSLKSVYLVHELHYADENTARSNEPRVHAAMNQSFGSTFGPDAFNATYHAYDKILRISLYANVGDLSSGAGKYFLLDDSSHNKNHFIKGYEAQGFTCINNK